MLTRRGQTPDDLLDSVGSDSWLASLFITGNDPDGYLLGSVQLTMADPTGGPGGFTVMIYSRKNFLGVSPGSNLETLSSSSSIPPPAITPTPPLPLCCCLLERFTS